MSAPSELQLLSDRLRDRLVERYELVEVGRPYAVLTLSATGEAVGEVRAWTGRTLPKLVDSRLVVPDLGIDSVMLHAFAPADSAVPHLASDVAGLRGRLTVNADLTPRVDLAVEPVYLDSVYPPLTAARSAAYAVPGARPGDLPLRLEAFGSPWMTAVSVGPDRTADVEQVLAAYADRFCALLENGVPAVSTADLAARDAAHRRAQFDAASDEVWDVLADLLGTDAVSTILDLVRDPGPPVAP